jgi:hypothetical protein
MYKYAIPVQINTFLLFNNFEVESNLSQVTKSFLMKNSLSQKPMHMAVKPGLTLGIDYSLLSRILTLHFSPRRTYSKKNF